MVDDLKTAEGNPPADEGNGEGASTTAKETGDDYIYTQKDLDSREIKLKKKFENRMARMKQDIMEEIKMESGDELEKLQYQLNKVKEENATLQEINNKYQVNQKRYQVEAVAAKLNAVDPEAVWSLMRDDVLNNEEINLEKSIAGLLKNKPYLVKPTMPQGGAGSKHSSAAPATGDVDMSKAENRIAQLKSILGPG